MINASTNNKRIARNTMLLYFRMLLTMSVSLYTSRVVLNILGVEDFGIYNVVGGVVGMFGFINSAMATGTQRYLTYEIGANNLFRLKTVFSTSLLIHFIVSIIVVVLAETVGLWFMTLKMNIPPERINAAFWVYQFSILSSIVMIMSVPYNAVIIAHEKMNAFAYISVLEVVLKLAVVYLLLVGSFDKLIFYAVLIFMIQLSIRFIYGVYCSRNFEETKFCWIWNEKLFKEMFSFAGWNLWGNCAFIALTQGLNIMLNIFFGPTVNAARAVSVQVQSAVNQFSFNFQTALNPQITKNYAKGDYECMHKLMFRSSKFVYLLLLALSFPFFVKTNFILSLWLNIVPEYTVVFLRLMLCTTILDAIANPFVVAIAATGKIKLYQTVIGGLLLSVLPISYLVLVLGGLPWSVFIVHLIICLFAFVVRIYIVSRKLQLSILDYTKFVLMPIIKVSILSVLISTGFIYYMPDTVLMNLVTCMICVAVVSVCSYIYGLTNNERAFINNKIIVIKNKIIGRE